MEKKQAIRYFGAVQFVYYAATALWSYVNIYFRELGFSAQSVGAVSAIGTIAAMVLLPVTGMLADKLQSPRRVFSWACYLLIPAFLALPLAGMVFGAQMVPIVTLATVLICCIQVANSALDSWSGMEMDHLGISYGSVRRFGSLGFVCMCLLASALVGPVLPAWTCCVMMSVGTVPLVFLLRKKGDGQAQTQTKQKELSTGKRLKLVLCNYYYVGFLLLHLGFCAYLGTVTLNMSYLMDYVGESQSSLGIISGLRAALEITAMYAVGKCKKHPPYWLLLGIGCMLVAGEQLLYPTVNSFAQMIINCTLTGIGGGLYYGLGANFVMQVVDERAASTAMAMMGTVKAAMGILGTFAGGYIIDTYGILTMTNLVGTVMVAMSAVFLVGCFVGRYVLKKPLVSERNT